jgi:DNA polymerase III delta prime subunit
MDTEILRPETLTDIVGHTEPKRILTEYLRPPYKGAVFLTGPPGIGKTTLALCAAKTLGFEPYEINASRSIRSYADVEALRDACASPVQIHSFILGNHRTTCVILDEIDGSDPHAQGKLVAWMKDPSRKVPIVCTGNDVPAVFKRNKDVVTIVKCFPPRPHEIQSMFTQDVSVILKECQYDVRRILHHIQ